MLNTIVVNEIVNALQGMRDHIDWIRFNHCNAYTTVSSSFAETIGYDGYYVQPIMSYTTVVGFAHNGIVYEVGKYSRTTSKQFTQIFNTYYPDYKRVYV